MKRKRLIALALVLLVGTLLFVIFDKPPALPAVMFLPPGPLAVKNDLNPYRLIPVKWTWLQRTCLFFLGRTRVITFSFQFLESSESVASILAQNSLGQAQAESNGLAVWIVPEDILERPKGVATRGRALRVISEEGMQARAMIKENVMAYSADVFSRLGKETVDLSTRLIVTSAAQTNFVAAMRAQIPQGHALFVLDVRHPESPTNRMAFVITADETDPAGNIIQRKPGER
jgi:hypothetical protein